jgi:hypothetical protein
MAGRNRIMIRSALLVLATVTLLVDGCSGSSRRSSQSQELSTFVAQVVTVGDSVRVCDVRFPHDVSANEANQDPSTWPSAAAAFQKYAACLRHIGERLSAIHAPSAVADAYTGYANDWGDEADVGDGMARDLLDKDRAAIRDWQNGPNSAPARRITQLNNHLIIPFRMALIHYASRLRVTLPPWVKTLGVFQLSSTPTA